MYDENEKPASKGVFIDQQKDGLWLYYNTTNNLRDLHTDEGILLKKENYKNGVKDGLFQTFSAETAILLDEQHFKAGKLHGVAINYYVSGDTNTIYNYIDGKLNGRYISYYPNKKIYERGIYHLNNKIGEWNYFDYSGKLRKTVRHQELNEEETVLYFYQGSEPQPLKQNLIAYVKKIDDTSISVTLTNKKSFVFKDSYTTILDWLDFIKFTPITKSHIAATSVIKSFSEKGKGSILVTIFPDLELLTDGDYAQNIISLFNRETLKEE
jgi:antitoxin component YwqK of YwqJK toxin-antitoxin module